MNNQMYAWINCGLIEDRLDSSSYLSKLELGLDKIYGNSNFKIITLMEICEEIVDGPFGSAILESDYVKEGIPFIRVQNVTDYGLDCENLIFISEESNKRIGRSECKPGDLVITKTGRLGTTAILDDTYSNYNIRGDLAKLRVKEEYDKYYIMMFLNSPFGNKLINSYSSGTTRGRILLSNIRKIVVPIPELFIQRYIADKIKKAEKLKNESMALKKEAEDCLYKNLNIEEYVIKQKDIQNKYLWIDSEEIDARIDSGFYNPAYIIYKDMLKDKGIEFVKIRDIVNTIKTGTTPENNIITKEKMKVKFIRVNNIEDCILNEDDLLYIDDNYIGTNLRFLNKDDILVSIAGTLGKTAVVDQDKCITNQNLASLSLNNKYDIKPYYLSLFLNSFYGKLALERISTQATVKYINNELLGEIEIPIIEKDKQCFIENKIIEYKIKLLQSRNMVNEAKEDIENLIKGKFDASKIGNTI